MDKSNRTVSIKRTFDASIENRIELLALSVLLMPQLN